MKCSFGNSGFHKNAAKIVYFMKFLRINSGFHENAGTEQRSESGTVI